jgi:hypothetical protein
MPSPIWRCQMDYPGDCLSKPGIWALLAKQHHISPIYDCIHNLIRISGPSGLNLNVVNPVLPHHLFASLCGTRVWIWNRNRPGLADSVGKGPRPALPDV